MQYVRTCTVQSSSVQNETQEHARKKYEYDLVDRVFKPKIIAKYD